MISRHQRSSASPYFPSPRVRSYHRRKSPDDEFQTTAQQPYDWELLAVALMEEMRAMAEHMRDTRTQWREERMQWRERMEGVGMSRDS